MLHHSSKDFVATVNEMKKKINGLQFFQLSKASKMVSVAKGKATIGEETKKDCKKGVKRLLLQN